MVLWCIVSFDLSLLADVPLLETIELIFNRLYADSDSYSTSFEKAVFCKLIHGNSRLIHVQEQTI